MTLTADQIFNQAIKAHQNNNLSEAEKLYREVLLLQPRNYGAHLNLGVVLQMKGKLDEAKINFNAAIKYNPKLIEAHMNLGGVNYKLNNLKKAEENYINATKLKPDYAQAYFNLGIINVANNRIDQAANNYEMAIKLNPKFAEAHNNLAFVYQKIKKFNESLLSFKKAIEIKPDYFQAYFNLGNLYYDLNKIEDALSCYEQSLKFNPNFAEAYFKIGISLNTINKLDEALVNYEKAIDLKSNYFEVYNNIGIIFQKKGKIQQAEENYNKAIKLNPYFTEAFFNLSRIKTFVSEDENLKQLQNIYLNKDLNDNNRIYLNFSLAKIYEDLKKFKNSFDHYVEGNSICKKVIGYNIKEDIDLFNQIKDTYPSIKKNSFNYEKKPNEINPIFIIGMPRSGTSLVEQIVSSHSEVSGAGELNFVRNFGDYLARGISEINNDTLLNFRNRYLDKLKHYSFGNSFIIDKMPLNFKYLGLLKIVFPEAKIIHTVRNAAATCWGNYQQLFANKEIIRFCYDLDDISSYFNLYKDLMIFWNNEFKDKIYNLNYDELTLNQEMETKNLIKYLGLNWDKKCLSPENNTRSVATASNSQVRHKVYKGSSQKWKNFQTLLNGKFDRLDDY